MKSLMQRKTWLVLILAVFVSVGVYFVTGVPTAVDCVGGIALICIGMCNGIVTGTTPKCVNDSSYTGQSRTTCLCGNKIGGNQMFKYGDGDDDVIFLGNTCRLKADADCRKCVEDRQELYICDSSSAGNLEELNKAAVAPNLYCGCASPGAAVNKANGRGAKGKTSAHPQGNFPPILTELSKALQQVQNKFSGRQ